LKIADFIENVFGLRKQQLDFAKILFSAPQVAPKNFKLTALSSYCVNMSYDPVLYPNGPQSGLVYQVKQ